jgi:hypothetical protein
MTEQEYREITGLRSSDIKAGQTSMRHMRASVHGQLKKESPALAWGATVHGAILEPERFWPSCAVWRDGAKRGKAWEAFKESNAGKTILSETEETALEAIIDAVYAKPEAADLLLAARHEILQTWTHPKCGPCKARVDGIAEKSWFELKTTRDVGARRFASQFYSLGYDLQVGWYSLAPEVADMPCYVIAAESEPPYDVVVYHMPSDVIEAGREKAIEIATRYRACEALVVWPGADLGNGVVEFVPPAWAGGGGWTVENDTEKEG